MSDPGLSHMIGQDGHLDQSYDSDLGDSLGEYRHQVSTFSILLFLVSIIYKREENSAVNKYNQINHIIHRKIEPMLVPCWPSVVDGGPTLNRHWFHVSHKQPAYLIHLLENTRVFYDGHSVNTCPFTNITNIAYLLNPCATELNFYFSIIWSWNC